MEIKPFSSDISYGNDTPCDASCNAPTPASDRTEISNTDPGIVPDGFIEITDRNYRAKAKTVARELGVSIEDIANAMAAKWAFGREWKEVSVHPVWRKKKEITERMGYSTKDINDTTRIPGKMLPWWSHKSLAVDEEDIKNIVKKHGCSINAAVKAAHKKYLIKSGKAPAGTKLTPKEKRLAE